MTDTRSLPCPKGLACDNAKMTGWSSHLDGAKALIRLRGKDVIKNSTPEGIEMFQLVRSMSVSRPLACTHTTTWG